jgi:SAM-dependent methyltransferase
MLLPLEFDHLQYKKLHGDLALMTNKMLLEHYANYGKYEGRICSKISNRAEFAALVSNAESALEIGPFAAPMLTGDNVFYCDVLDTSELIERATSLNIPTANIPNIDYKLDDRFLDGIERKFKTILSSHAIEHQPDLIEHFQQIERRLEMGGRYFLLIPDKRYCFDSNFPPSDIADVIQAHNENRARHTLANIIRHRALATHNDPLRHWANKGSNPSYVSNVDPHNISEALDEFRHSKGSYIDVHGWFFTPDSFMEIVRLTNSMGYHSLSVERLFRTKKNELEFWIILKNGDYEPSEDELVVRKPEVLYQQFVTKASLRSYVYGLLIKLIRFIKR